MCYRIDLKLMFMYALVSVTGYAQDVHARDTIDGAWQMVVAKRAGKPAGPADRVAGFIFDAGRVRMYDDLGGVIKGDFKEDTRAVPHRLDIRSLPAGDVVFDMRGIWEMRGSALKLSLSWFADESVYPTTFKSSESDKWVYFELKRRVFDFDQWNGEWIVQKATVDGTSDRQKVGEVWTLTRGDGFETTIRVKGHARDQDRVLRIFSTPFNTENSFFYDAKASDSRDIDISMSGKYELTTKTLRLKFGEVADEQDKSSLDRHDPWAHNSEYFLTRPKGSPAP